MYRLLSTEVDHRGGFGEGVLTFCDETHDIEYFHEYYLVDILGRQRIGRTKSELAEMRKRGYWFDGSPHQGIGKPVLRRICSLLIMLRYHVYALVDTDGYFWYLDSDGVPEIHLGDICRYVTRHSIKTSDYHTIYNFDDSLEFVYPYPDCFKRGVRWISNKPCIEVGNKYKDFFLNTDVAIV